MSHPSVLLTQLACRRAARCLTLASRDQRLQKSLLNRLRLQQSTERRIEPLLRRLDLMERLIQPRLGILVACARFGQHAFDLATLRSALDLRGSNHVFWREQLPEARFTQG